MTIEECKMDNRKPTDPQFNVRSQIVDVINGFLTHLEYNLNDGDVQNGTMRSVESYCYDNGISDEQLDTIKLPKEVIVKLTVQTLREILAEYESEALLPEYDVELP